jgi:hypothetical protein
MLCRSTWPPPRVLNSRQAQRGRPGQIDVWDQGSIEKEYFSLKMVEIQLAAAARCKPRDTKSRFTDEMHGGSLEVFERGSGIEHEAKMKQNNFC